MAKGATCERASRVVGHARRTPLVAVRRPSELTEDGAAFRDDLERRTDELAYQPYRDGLTEPGLDLLPSLLAPLGTAVAGSGIIPFPNPIGLTAPTT